MVNFNGGCLTGDFNSHFASATLLSRVVDKNNNVIWARESLPSEGVVVQKGGSGPRMRATIAPISDLLSDLAAAGIDLAVMLGRGGFLFESEVHHSF